MFATDDSLRSSKCGFRRAIAHVLFETIDDPGSRDSQALRRGAKSV